MTSLLLRSWHRLTQRFRSTQPSPRALPNSQGSLDPGAPTSDLPCSPEKNSPREAGKKQRDKLLPVRHPTRDFFLCDVLGFALKSDNASMEAPIFTLSTRPDLSEWRWQSQDGSRSLTVTPSILGRATQFDKDLLIYITSQMTEALNQGRPDACNRTVRFTAYDYLVSTNRTTDGHSYKRLSESFTRLRGTTLRTNIKAGGQRVSNIFGILDQVEIVEKSPQDERMIAVEVTLSKWLFSAIQAREVLTLHPHYFRLRSPLERRLYEIARKHVGHQAMWSIRLELLREKAGSRKNTRGFRHRIRKVIKDDTLPDYRLALDGGDHVIFYIRDPKRLAARLSTRARPSHDPRREKPLF